MAIFFFLSSGIELTFMATRLFYNCKRSHIDRQLGIELAKRFGDWVSFASKAGILFQMLSSSVHMSHAQGWLGGVNTREEERRKTEMETLQLEPLCLPNCLPMRPRTA